MLSKLFHFQLFAHRGRVGGALEQEDLEAGGRNDMGFLEDLEGEGENKIGGLGRHPVHGVHQDCDKLRNWLN